VFFCFAKRCVRFAQVGRGAYHVIGYTSEIKTELWYVASALDEDVYSVHSSNENMLATNRNGNGTFPKVTATAG
jgi:hypothetical protein